MGDARQNTFDTAPSTKDKKYSKNIYDYFSSRADDNQGKIRHMFRSWRCNQHICDFSDKLFPEFPKTYSNNSKETNHDGIFLVNESNLDKYYELYKPQILIWDKRAKNKIGNKDAKNIGVSKGQTFERVLIVPTQPMLSYLKKNEIESIPYKFYIALTRAKYSASFLIPDKKFNCCHPEVKLWTGT